MGSTVSTTKAPTSLGNKFAVQQEIVSIAKCELERTILSFFTAVVRVLESNPQLGLKQASFDGADVVLSTIEVGAFGVSSF